jgi:hypothetical protein
MPDPVRAVGDCATDRAGFTVLDKRSCIDATVGFDFFGVACRDWHLVILVGVQLAIEHASVACVVHHAGVHAPVRVCGPPSD